MSIARAAIHDWERRTARPGPHNNDAHFQYQTFVLQDLVDRLEIIMDDEGIPEEKIRRVIRCMLYGSPHPADALVREEQQKQITELLMTRPPAPISVSQGIFEPPI
jgi:hypothetical protein